jgi:nitrate reductase gamma subunit
MTLKEKVLIILGFIAACAVLLLCIALIIRRAMNKPTKHAKHDRSGDHYHESGIGDDPGGHH